jgi:hypothetical protein
MQSKVEMSTEIRSFRTDLDGSRQQLQAANSLQPEMESVRQQLAQAVKDIQSQQKVISSSEDFVKNVFSSHATEYFNVGLTPANRYIIIPPVTQGGLTTVLMLLRSVPIPNTLQLQFNIYTQPPNSYTTIKNLVIFFWHDPPETLKTQQLSAAYFPDEGDKDTIQALLEHDGRAFADDQPLPKFNQPDPDFKGNKWMPLTTKP